LDTEKTIFWSWQSDFDGRVTREAIYGVEPHSFDQIVALSR